MLEGKIILILLSALLAVSLASATDIGGSCGVVLTASDTYTMSQNIVDNSLSKACVNISGNGIIFDCNGFSISSTSDIFGAIGILINSSDVRIIDCNLNLSGRFSRGIFLEETSNVSVLETIVQYSFVGIDVEASSGVNLTNIIIIDNLLGIDVTQSEDIILTNITGSENTEDTTLFESEVILQNSNINKVFIDTIFNSIIRDNNILNGGGLQFSVALSTTQLINNRICGNTHFDVSCQDISVGDLTTVSGNTCDIIINPENCPELVCSPCFPPPEILLIRLQTATGSDEIIIELKENTKFGDWVNAIKILWRIWI